MRNFEFVKQSDKYLTGNVCFRCRNEDGVVVDWWILYKLPNNLNTIDTQPPGHRYFYRTSTSPRDINIYSSRNIDADNSILYQTVNSVVLDRRKSPPYDYFAFNNEAPENFNNLDDNKTLLATYAHAKGIAVFSKAPGQGRGFWMTHTVPTFIIRRGDSLASRYPNRGFVNAQTAICVTLSGHQDPNIVNYKERMCHMNVRILAHDEYFCLGHQNLHFLHTTPQRLIFNFLSHVHNIQENMDIYHELGIFPFPALQSSNFFVQTWRNTGGEIINDPNWIHNSLHTSTCVQFGTANFHFTWTTTHDHGKVATDSRGFYCFGDLNRVQSQRIQGGGVICFQLHNTADLNPFVRLSL